MSTNHRAEAEALLKQAAKEFITEGDPTPALAAAQVHATLARNEEQAATTADLRDALTLVRRREQAMRELVATHVVSALASQGASRQKAALELTRALDEAGANLDDLINDRLPAGGWAPTSAAPADDPWAAKPDITAEIPEPVRRVIAGHLAEMLLDPTAGEVHRWARGIAYELKNVGADLTDAIKARITDLTLGRDPSEPPF